MHEITLIIGERRGQKKEKRMRFSFLHDAYALSTLPDFKHDVQT